MAEERRLRLEVLTIERQLIDEQVDMVIAPAIEGQVGILPNHAPLLTTLDDGELIVRREGEEDMFLAVGGGVMQVLPDHVVVLADAAEHADEIDLERAEEAHQRAQELLEQSTEQLDLGRARLALRRSAVRMAVARRRRPRGDRRGAPTDTSS